MTKYDELIDAAQTPMTSNSYLHLRVLSDLELVALRMNAEKNCAEGVDESDFLNAVDAEMKRRVEDRAV